jgi:hypothetical protein
MRRSKIDAERQSQQVAAARRRGPAPPRGGLTVVQSAPIKAGGAFVVAAVDSCLGWRVEGGLAFCMAGDVHVHITAGTLVRGVCVGPIKCTDVAHHVPSASER